MCIPGLGLLDEAAALMIAQLLERQGIGARVEQADALSISRISSWEIKGIALVCLCYVGNASSAQIRYAIRRIRRRAPDTTTLVALLGDSEDITGQALSENTELVQHSLRATVDKIVAMASDSSGEAKSQTRNGLICHARLIRRSGYCGCVNKQFISRSSLILTEREHGAVFGSPLCTPYCWTATTNGEAA